MSSEPQPVTLLRVKRVMERTGIPFSSLYQLINAGKFPRPVQLSPNRVAWVESEVEAWIRQRIDASQKITRKHSSKRRVASKR